MYKSSVTYIYIIYITFIFFIGCQTAGPKIDKDIYDTLSNINRSIEIQNKQNIILEDKILLNKELISNYILEIDTVLKLQTTGLELSLSNVNNSSIEKDLLIALDVLQKKISVLEDRSLYTDSLYFSILKNLVVIENKILFSKGVKESSSQLKSEVRGENNISLKEFNDRYIDALSDFQNSKLESSLNKFNYLISLEMNHELKDNCQYWIGEIFYALHDYERSIIELKKVNLYKNSNKLDDAYYKIALCYKNLGKSDIARNQFNAFLKDFPNSEYADEVKNKLQ